MALPGDFSERFWKKDTTLWSGGKYGGSIPEFMGWIDIAETMKGNIAEIEEFVADVKAAGFERVVLAGMGGSSLAPLLLQTTLEQPSGLPLEVLDSTDPETVLRIERLGPVEKCLFIIASKSGSTAEPNAFNDYFYEKVKEVKGDKVGENFAAITDPGSPFQTKATNDKFRKIFLNPADIGGRYSALSYFGMVPAALMGIDLNKFLDHAVKVQQANGPEVPVSDAPGFQLGQMLGDLANKGRNKLTFILPESMRAVGLWMEQLVAESTGKEGKGILPIATEKAGPPSDYGDDRVFAYIRLATSDCSFLDMRIAALRDAGHPIIDKPLSDLYQLAGEFLEWEFATAVAGSVIEINPFDQPNVQESKDITKKFVKEVEEKGSLPEETPNAIEGDKAAFGGTGSTLDETLSNFLSSVKPGDYICLQAYLTESTELNAALEKLQAELRDKYKVPCTNGYGPRFLHSTGQFHKGGPNTGHFIQLSKDDREDAPLPGKQYTFGTFRNAQYRGDAETLKVHDRRVIRLHLGKNPEEAVAALSKSVSSK